MLVGVLPGINVIWPPGGGVEGAIGVDTGRPASDKDWDASVEYAN